jgi:hypothetical protein
VGGYCYHVVNRGNARAEVFRHEGDYATFGRLPRQASARLPMRILAYLPDQTIVKHGERKAVAVAGQEVQEVCSIGVVVEECLAGVTAIEHVIAGGGGPEVGTRLARQEHAPIQRHGRDATGASGVAHQRGAARWLGEFMTETPIYQYVT